MERIAVLTSGGLDSCVLLADLARESTVYPIYVQFGLAWERAEQDALAGYLGALNIGDPPMTPARYANIQPLTTLQVPVAPMYGGHWSLTGENVPDYDAAIDADYLPGRNVLLLGLTAVWCALHDTHKIALGSLMQNPYSDATPAFFRDYASLLTGALSHGIEVLAPYRGREKDELIREHPELPLHLTLTCIGQKPGEAPDAAPGEGPLHCGACLKCHERHEAFVEAGVEDRTRYAAPPGQRIGNG
ncbi:MAG TPA: 7-cyano-7-deazaguanine synthase [Dehalococcoidia bacterium]